MITRKPRGYWTLEKCKIEALKYIYKFDFRKKSSCAYNATYRHGWMNEVCFHMKTTGDKYHRCVYVYEFSDNHAYVGLTYNIDVRIRARNKNIKDSVNKYMGETGLKPELKILTNFVPVNKAIKLEEHYYQEYKNNGWLMLNQVKTGSVGTINKWTKEKCINEAKKCKNRTDFYSKSGLYQASKQHGWLDEVLSYISLKRMFNGYWTKEKCIERALLCDSRTEFRKLYGSAYTISNKNGWLKDVYLTVNL